MPYSPDALVVDQHLTARSTCLKQYTAAMGITFAVSLANLFLILAHAPSASMAARLAIAISVITIATYGALAGRAALEEAKAIIDDHVEAMPGTRYATSIGALPIGMFTALTVALIALMCVAQLYLLLTV